MCARLLSAAVFAVVLGGGAAQAATLRLESFTVPAQVNTTILATPAGSTGRTFATGFNMTDGVYSFVAWCLDLAHSISKGGPYQYEDTSTPFSNSFLASGAAARVQSVFDANYGTLNVHNTVDAAAFQLSLWEVAYDDNFSLGSGTFRGAGYGATAAAITNMASTFLGRAQAYAGGQRYDVSFLESQDSTQRQNLVTAVPAPVPLPAGLPLLAAGIAAVIGLRFRHGTA
ncbi:MAG: hypothetical protein ACK5IB_07095 [Qingshengfaniella sp.]